MNDERFLRDWLQDTTDSTVDPNATADKVFARISSTPQRRRWLPWPSPRRPEVTPPNGRTHAMLNPTNAFFVGALSLTVGVALLIAAPVDQQDARDPGAEADFEMAPSIFTGTLGWEVGRSVSLDSAESGVHDDGWTFAYDQGFEGSGWETSDPRFSGALDWITSEEEAPSGATAGSIATTLMRIRNDEGSWTGVATWLSHEDSGRAVSSAWLTGDGAYDGLMAYVALVDWQEIVGFITPEGRPRAPQAFPMDLAE